MLGKLLCRAMFIHASARICFALRSISKESVRRRWDGLGALGPYVALQRGWPHAEPHAPLALRPRLHWPDSIIEPDQATHRSGLRATRPPLLVGSCAAPSAPAAAPRLRHTHGGSGDGRKFPTTKGDPGVGHTMCPPAAPARNCLRQCATVKSVNLPLQRCAAFLERTVQGLRGLTRRRSQLL